MKTEMIQSNVSVALLCLLCLGFLSIPCHAQDSPSDFLDAHNAAQAEVGVGPMIWDDKIATYARNYASCRVVDCRPMISGGPYGENVAWSTGNFYARDVVNIWVKGKAYYNYKSNTCTKYCKSYTHVVWRNSVHLGCARVKCNNGGTFIGCNYDPSGNILGERPY